MLKPLLMSLVRNASSTLMYQWLLVFCGQKCARRFVQCQFPHYWPICSSKCCHSRYIEHWKSGFVQGCWLLGRKGMREAKPWSWRPCQQTTSWGRNNLKNAFPSNEKGHIYGCGYPKHHLDKRRIQHHWIFEFTWKCTSWLPNNAKDVCEKKLTQLQTLVGWKAVAGLINASDFRSLDSSQSLLPQEHFQAQRNLMQANRPYHGFRRHLGR